MMIERKFKVGDRVRGYSNSGTVKLLDDTKDVLFQYYVKFDDDCWEWVKAEDLEPLLPAIPSGWTPASEPPDSDRNVRVVLKDGREWYGWYYEDGSECGSKDDPAWLIIHDGEDMSRINADKLCDARDAAPGEVIAWREIEPERKADPRVRYAVRYSDTVKDKDDDGDYYLTMDEAAVEAKRLVAKYGKEIEVGHWVVDAVVKPAEPEVIRMEE